MATSFQFIGAKKPKRLPVVLTKGEVQQALSRLAGEYHIIAQLLYGSGLRVAEVVRLRVTMSAKLRNGLLTASLPLKLQTGLLSNHLMCFKRLGRPFFTGKFEGHCLHKK